MIKKPLRKTLETVTFRRIEDVRRRSELADATLEHEDDLVGDARDEAHLVREDRRCHTLPAEVGHEIKRPLDELGVKRARHFVE